MTGGVLVIDDAEKAGQSELAALHERTLEALANVIEYRSLESGTHIRHIVELTRIVVGCLSENPDYANELTAEYGKAVIRAVALHDIGKIGIPDSILLKPGKLGSDEFEIIKSHTIIGSDIIDSIAKDAVADAKYLNRVREICRHHHERWDGKGYPDGLKGASIPLSARILAIVDVYDALVSARCYKPAYTHEEALHIMKNGRATQFDPNILYAFLGISDEISSVKL